MNAVYKEALKIMGNSFEILSQNVPQPTQLLVGDMYFLRYKEKTIHQAMILKLARIITGLQAIVLLNENGFLQEQAALQRTLDEFDEDILFLSLGVIYSDITDRHKRYLEYFYEEEIKYENNEVKHNKQRATVPRKKIRAFINKYTEIDNRQNLRSDPSAEISKVYSGFIHGASPQIMDLYYGTPGKFQLFDRMSSPYLNDHTEDMFNNYYRGCLSFAFSAKAFGYEKMFNDLLHFAKNMAIENDKNY